MSREIERAKVVNRLTASIQYHISHASAVPDLRDCTLRHLRLANEALMAIRLIVSNENSDALNILRAYKIASEQQGEDREK